MKKLFLTIIAAMATIGTVAQAQDAQQAAADAAAAVSAAPEVAPKVEKPKYWSTSLKTQINVGQTGLFNWAAGGDNTVSLAAFIDGNANWKKDDMFWNNRLQLDYGFLYASSKPLLQKSTDRIYLESKWGCKTPSMKNFYFSANYDFKSQFSTGYDYKTPSVPATYKDGTPIPEGTKLDQLELKHQRELWKDARVLKSNFLAPAYTNLALGIDYVPAKWFSLNFAPLTGGFVIVKDAALRESYKMGLKKAYDEDNFDKLSDDAKAKFEAAKADKANNPEAYGDYFRSAKFEFGAQLKMDAKVNINDNFSYSTQVVLFANYLDIKHCPRINWDNRIDWKLAKYFSLTLTTNLIYDDQIMIKNDKDIDKYPDGKARVQFKESIAFGFTYTIANKK
ncbi:MAG: DUF3078 domain-containing protein [Bacteroidales bacterium]|nr:DUF3078 domain-containing protein [Bacteroidales bacterium]